MPPQVSDQDLGDAILRSVENGAFPQSEDVASALVTSTVVPKLLAAVDKAREDTKNEIRKLSRETAPDVDGWIAQARKLQGDIKRSQETAHEIVQQAESGKNNAARVQDAAAKVSFLYSEITYNESLVQVVEQVRDISALLEAAQEAAVHGHVIHALNRLEDGHGALKRLGPFGNTRVVGVLRSKADQLRAAIVETTTESWNALILADTAERRLSLKEEIQNGESIHIKTVVEALTKLNLLDGFISRLSRDLDTLILSSRLVIGADRLVSSFEIDRDDIQVKGHVSDMSVQAALQDIQGFAEYLSTRLPPSIAIPLSDKWVPIMAKQLIDNWLLPAVPLSPNGVSDFEETLSLVLGLALFFDELEWTGQDRLRDWVDKSPEIWLARRKATAIARVRAFCPRRVREKKTVERVETQMVSKGDAVLGAQEEQDEDWGAEWGDEAEPGKDGAAPQADEVEEEDMSAWGIDDDEPAEEIQQESKPPEQGDNSEEDTEAWGWGEEDETQPVPLEPSSKPSEQKKSNVKATVPQKLALEKELTLRETYTVTAIPDSIVEIIMQTISDVGILNKPDLINSIVAPASVGLYAIPSLLLAMYRATAATHYSKDVAGNMLIYNDCSRLSDRLRSLVHQLTENDKTSSIPQHLRPSVSLKLDNDIKTIEAFGKRAYGREMESQRTIVRDLLDGAQGFQTCTAAPFAAECDNAIAMTIDRITEVKRQWQTILSHSALLQSLGSLVSTALTKFITDVEDITDIAEDESRKLHGYVVSLSSLSSLFQTEDAAGTSRDMTNVYTPNWFKFQYLGEILDSSLADIQFLWTGSELKLEMEAEEVVDLIKALFAESDYRRKAIGAIRRATLRRYALSSLVNSLLHTKKPIPFEFLINGQFLRTSIDEFLTQNGISAESTLNVEYTRALIPPLHVASFEHDDWVSAVDVLSQTSPAGVWSGEHGIQSGQEQILTASYDGLLRVWNLSGDAIAISTPPYNSGRITSLKTAKWLSNKKIVAAGLDNVVRVYKYDEDTRAITQSLELYNHRWGVEDVAVHGPTNRILSASTDATISLFSATAKDSPAAPSTLLPTSTTASNKRQKLSKPEKSVPTRGALTTLSGHTAPASNVIFKPEDATVAYSASHDHTLRTWDLPTSTCVDTRTTSHSLLSLTALPKLNLLATGTSARHITLIDPRASATQIAVMTLRGHLNAVVSLDTNPNSEYGLVSASHDGTCRIWDVRSVKPNAGAMVDGGQVGESVYVVEREGMGGKSKASGDGVKVFGVRWDADVGIVSTGEDKRVQINRGVGERGGG
ncbi:WD40 repeat-like protein [Lindgomyces ingoldianus]|uniref:WD40 repeat-like protein n=1 Tax=Lindgomyces ingoldianus TaxID=673940 RepID=A0ACB6R633_9PLEO|nr:WD40 repeat-like protein [Lindgomyces ingoldianus]KAF2474510.1 WD40 repeat-like protein [Lindgomyces ingoldianus]